jgi:hypothetical protein
LEGPLPVLRTIDFNPDAYQKATYRSGVALLATLEGWRSGYHRVQECLTRRGIWCYKNVILLYGSRVDTCIGC